MSAINEAVEAVIGLMNETRAFARVTRGALPTGDGIACEIGPSSPRHVFMDKGVYIPFNLVINAKHMDLQLVMETMNGFHRALTQAREYPSGDGWQIVDIANAVMPQIVGRESDNRWLAASTLSVRIYLGA